MLTSIAQPVIDLRSGSAVTPPLHVASTPAVALDLIDSLSKFNPAQQSAPTQGLRIGANLDRYL